MDKKVPLDYYQATNAVKLAKGRGRRAVRRCLLQKATDMLEQAKWNLEDKKGNKKAVAPMSRQVVQQAEDSRQIAIKKQAEEKIGRRSARVEEKAAAREEGRGGEGRRRRGEGSRRPPGPRSAGRGGAEDRGHRSGPEAGRPEGRRLYKGARPRQHEQEKAKLRAQLKEQLNAIMQTTDSARGLIVSMKGLLFKSGKAELLPPVREKLARVAGILLGHPGLSWMSRGHTDDVGKDDMNQTLSEKRAAAVRD
jgi:flagellar motor protein MotB